MQSHQRQLAASSVSAQSAASHWPTELSLLGTVLEKKTRSGTPHEQHRSAVERTLPPIAGETDGGELKLVPFGALTDMALKTVSMRFF